MVQAVTGRNLLAVFPGSPAAQKLAQQNLVLPSPLQASEQQTQQRASVLRAAAAPISSDTLNALTEQGLRGATRERSDTSANAARQAAEAYSQVYQGLRGVVALANPTASLPNVSVIAPPASTESEQSRTVIRAPEPRENSGPREDSGTRETNGRENGQAAGANAPTSQQGFGAAPAAQDNERSSSGQRLVGQSGAVETTGFGGARLNTKPGALTDITA